MTDQQQLERPRLVLIDGYGLIFRAYHALPPTMATRSGEQTNAVFGFAAMFLDVIRQHHPEFIAVALESGRTFRHDAYDGYKATRSAMPGPKITSPPPTASIARTISCRRDPFNR